MLLSFQNSPDSLYCKSAETLSWCSLSNLKLASPFGNTELSSWISNTEIKLANRAPPYTLRPQLYSFPIFPFLGNRITGTARAENRKKKLISHLLNTILTYHLRWFFEALMCNKVFEHLKPVILHLCSASDYFVEKVTLMNRKWMLCSGSVFCVQEVPLLSETGYCVQEVAVMFRNWLGALMKWLLGSGSNEGVRN